ncbi:hypothetical protein Tco_0764709, partial [Tanacetum coccineum]
MVGSLGYIGRTEVGFTKALKSATEDEPKLSGILCFKTKGFLRPLVSHSPWGAPVLFVKKKDGSLRRKKLYARSPSGSSGCRGALFLGLTPVVKSNGDVRMMIMDEAHKSKSLVPRPRKLLMVILMIFEIMYWCGNGNEDQDIATYRMERFMSRVTGRLLQKAFKARREAQSSERSSTSAMLIIGRKALNSKLGDQVLLGKYTLEVYLFWEKKREKYGCDCSKRLKHSKISLLKVCWNSKRGPEFTWEREDYMKSKYPQLFVDRADEWLLNPGTRFFLKDGGDTMTTMIWIVREVFVKILLESFGKLSISCCDYVLYVMWYAPWLCEQLESFM